MKSLWAAALLVLGTAAGALDTQRYLELSVEMLEEGNQGWQEIVERLRQGDEETAETIAALKQEMATGEQRLLSKYGTSREEFEQYYVGHRAEVDRVLLHDEKRQQKLLDLTVELRSLLTEYARLTSGSEDDEASREAPPPD